MNKFKICWICLILFVGLFGRKMASESQKNMIKIVIFVWLFIGNMYN